MKSKIINWVLWTIAFILMYIYVPEIYTFLRNAALYVACLLVVGYIMAHWKN